MYTKNRSQFSRHASEVKVAVYSVSQSSPEADNQQRLQQALGVALIGLSAIAAYYLG
jgi:hypothetical protein